MTEQDRAALAWLTATSLLAVKSEAEREGLLDAMERGNAVAFSLRNPAEGEYRGLCILTLESPSPLPDKSLTIHVLTLDVFRAGGTGSRTGADPTVFKGIMEEVLRFCRTHGYLRVQCYVPCQNPIVAQLLATGFEIEGTQSHRDRPPRHYSLALELPTPYTGDPYDCGHLLNWLGERFRFLSNTEASDLALQGEIPLRSLNHRLGLVHAGDLRFGARLDFLPPGADTTPSIALAVGGADPTTAPAINLSLADLKELARTDRLVLDYWPPPCDGTSIAVEIRRPYFEGFSTSAAEQAYLDSGWYGTLIDRNIAAGQSSTIFFVDYETDPNDPTVLGWGSVKRIVKNRPFPLWEECGSLSSWTNLSDFRQYGSIKRKMTGIVFDELTKREVQGAGLPIISHSWTYVPGQRAYDFLRRMNSHG